MPFTFTNKCAHPLLFILTSIALLTSALFLLTIHLLFGIIHLALTLFCLSITALYLHRNQTTITRQLQIATRNARETRQLLELLHTGLFVIDTETYAILSLNTAAASMANIHKEELIGKPFDHYILSPKEVGSEAPLIIETGHSKEQRLYRHQLPPLDILISFQNATFNNKPCLLGSFADISAIKQAEATALQYTNELQRSRNTLISMMEDADASRKAIAETHEKLALIKQAVDSVQEAIAITTPSGICIYRNNGYVELFGDHIAPGGRLNPLRLCTDRAEAKKHIRISATEMNWSSEMEMRRANGTSFPAIIRSTIIRNAQNQTIGRIHVCHDITERKKAEATQAAYIQDLRKAKDISLSMMEDAEIARRETERMSKHLATSERRYRAVVEEQQELICRCGSNFSITFANQSFQSFFNLTPAGRKSLWELWPSHIQKDYQNELNQLMREGGTLNAEFMLTLSNATEHWTIWNITALKDQDHQQIEYQVVGRDETRRHLAEKELRLHREHLKELVDEKTIELEQANRKLEANLALQRRIAAQNMLLAKVIEQSDEMIFATDPNGIIIFTNQSYKELSPAERSGTAGKTFHNTLLSRIKKKKAWSGLLSCTQPDHSEAIYDCRINPVLGENGELLSIACSQRDITAKARLESQLRHAQKMQAVGTLVGGIAHDFNNLLMSISGFAHLARKKVNDEKTAKYIDNIIIAGKRGSSLVSQLMKFGRPDEIIASIREDEVNLEQLIDEVASLLSATLPSTISIHRSFHSQGTIRINSGQIHQVLINLCTNASHAMEGEGQLHLSVQDVELDECACREKGLSTPGPYACIRVKDTGCGIAPENLQRIFDPFFTTKEVGKGSGMGLAVAHGIIKEHEGVMRVESTLTGGSEFFIYLPKMYPREAIPR
jgi:PAS domain S-box-containing protein